eukprot:XP_001691868.1 predicted protein [Chlamydomonas reinhardtii]
MVWCIEVELGGQVQADRYLLTGGPLPGPREVTVGRPPAKAAVRPDIVVKEPSVSKIHAILSVEHAVGEQQGPALVLKDQSRVRQQPLVVAARLGGAALPEARAVLRRIGGRLVHALDAATTHVLHSPGEAAWPGLVHAAVRGGPALVSQDWLNEVADGGLFTNALPDAAPPTELVLGPGRRAMRLPQQPAAAAGAMLSGFTFGYSSAWQQSPGLAALIRECGGRVLATAGERSAATPVVTVADTADGGAAAGVDTQQLLLAILEGDSAALNELLSRATAASATARGAAAQPADDMDAEDLAADSDITQAAEEEDGAEDVDVVEQLPTGCQAQQAGLAAAEPAQAGGKPASIKTEDVGLKDVAPERPPPIMTADGWLVAARKSDAPSPGPQLLSNARADEAAAAHTIEHEDAPPAKRRRTLTNSSKAAAAAAAAAAAPGPSTASAAAPIAAPRAASAAAPAPAAFRKQTGQLPAAEVARQPLPVTLVDNFQREDAEAQAFLRQEEERAARKRAADEMFRTGGVGGGGGAKKPPRAKR